TRHRARTRLEPSETATVAPELNPEKNTVRRRVALAFRLGDARTAQRGTAFFYCEVGPALAWAGPRKAPGRLEGAAGTTVPVPPVARLITQQPVHLQPGTQQGWQEVHREQHGRNPCVTTDRHHHRDATR